MTTRIASQRVGSRTGQGLETRQWLRIALTAALAAIALVLITQMLALTVWPQTGAFRPLNSYVRSAIFTLIPALIAAALFARLARTRPNPETAFVKVAVVVLLLSFIPDYLLPDPNRTFLAGTIAAFLHLIAGITITTGLVLGYRRAKNSSH